MIRGQLIVQAYRSGLSADEVTTLLGEARELADASGDVHTLAFVVNAAGRYEFVTCAAGGFESPPKGNGGGYGCLRL